MCNCSYTHPLMNLELVLQKIIEDDDIIRMEEYKWDGFTREAWITYKKEDGFTFLIILNRTNYKALEELKKIGTQNTTIRELTTILNRDNVTHLQPK